MRALDARISLVRRTAIGLAVPPSGIANISPASLRIRGRIDDASPDWPILRAMADHQLFVFRRTQQQSLMIILFHPRAVKPKNRRFPLAILSVAAVARG